MNKQETWALFLKGKDAWNAWAKDMLAKRKVLGEAVDWQFGQVDEGETDTTEKWLEDAKADFADQEFTAEEFPDGVDFTGFIFPGDAWFERATFHGISRFESANFFRTAWFERAKFGRSAWFEKAEFRGLAWFGNAEFRGVALFGKAVFGDVAWFSNANFRLEGRFEVVEFGDDARFDRATFGGDAWFGRAVFRRIVRFVSATFGGEAWFERATFRGIVRFGSATFGGDAWFGSTTFYRDARFSHATFASYATFQKALFKGRSEFGAIEVKRAFTLKNATFKQMPDFIQANFAEAPRLDELAIQPRSLRTRVFKGANRLFKRGPLLVARWRLLKVRWRRRYRALRNSPLFAKDATLAARWNALSGSLQGDENLEARWRALKKLAEEAKDHPREQEFFKGELKARRWNSDWPWHPVFWFALVYEVLSGFGRSFLRPVFWLIVATVVFDDIYLNNHRGYVVDDRAPTYTCVIGSEHSDAESAAFSLSLRNTLPFAGLGGPEKLNQVYRCLYGVEGEKSAGFPESRMPPHIPDNVAIWSFVQTIISAVLIFLFLLAVRNHFRIR